MVFKLVQRTGPNGEKIPVSKNASGKKSIGGLKKAFRTFDNEGIITGEYFTTEQNPRIPENAKLTQVVLIDNNVYTTESIETARTRHQESVMSLPTDSRLTLAGTPTFESTEV